jgi:hypothetical protein
MEDKNHMDLDTIKINQNAKIVKKLDNGCTFHDK